MASRTFRILIAYGGVELFSSSHYSTKRVASPVHVPVLVPVDVSMPLPVIVPVLVDVPVQVWRKYRI